MLTELFSKSVLGICAWDLPALIVLVVIVVIFVVYRRKLKKRERELEDELAGKWADESIEETDKEQKQ